MTGSLTPFYAILVYPLESVDGAALEAAGWVSGPVPYAVTIGQEALPEDRQPSFLQGSARVDFYADPGPVKSLLERRWWTVPDMVDPHLRIVAQEVVELEGTWSRVAGHLIVHVESVSGAAEMQAHTKLAKWLRPATNVGSELQAALPPDGARPWVRVPTRRAGCLALSGVPGEDERGSVRWPGMDPAFGRLADLVVLRSDSSTIDRPFELDVEHPTPSYLLSASGHSVAAVRLRSVNSAHITKLRTLWLDAYLVELVQAEELQQLSRLLRSTQRPDWSKIAKDFRKFRLQDVWAASTDHPLEAALARRFRAELGTETLANRIQAELDDHVAAEQAAATQRLNSAVLLLTIATVVIPLFLQASGRTWDTVFMIAALLSIVAVAAVSGCGPGGVSDELPRGRARSEVSGGARRLVREARQ